MRHKEIYGVNVPLSLKFALEFGMSLVSEKIRSRVKVTILINLISNIITLLSTYFFLSQIFSSIKESHAYFDQSLLPKEYGGEMEMSKMIGKFIFNTHNFIINILFI